MKSKISHKFCYALSFLLAVGFVIALVRDFIVYHSTLNSAPFSLWIAIDCIYFLLPAGILFSIGLILKKRPIKKPQG